MIGKTISHFKILEELGSGGMGVVYRARDLDLDRDVALKFLPGQPGESARQRFIREAKAASALDHENICTIYEIGKTDEGATFIAMAHYGGETLRARVERGPLPINEAVDIARQIGSGLEAAHAQGIVHRDIKSDNIMVTDRGQVKILDFGLAKLTDVTRLTKEGSTVGTLAYMSPEQLRGEELDQRTDIWSLGVVLFEMLTGRLPFRAETEAAIGFQIVHNEPVSLTDTRRDVPEALQNVIDRALAKDLDKRYQSVSEMSLSLAPFGAESGVRPSGAMPAARKRPFFKNPVAIVLLVVLLVALIGLVVTQRQRGARATWARNVALPEIERLVDGTSDQTAKTDLWQAYDLGTEAEAVIPGDPLLERLLARCARTFHFRSKPSGARVYAKAYVNLEGEWRAMGETPLDVRLPKAYARVKIEKEGYETLVDLVWNSPWSSDTLTLEFHKPESVPPGMVWVPASDRELRLPGLEGFDAERVPGFWIDRFEVSNADYKRFVDAGGYRNREYWKHPFMEGGRTLTWEEAMERFRDRTRRPGPATWEVGDYHEGTGNDPVGGLSWYEAAAYAEFAGEMLPTVFHWNAVAFTWATPAIVSLANFEGAGPWPVDREDVLHTAGACNLAGNVREWCWNETSRENERMILGGGWNDPPYAFNDAYAQPMLDRSATNGFRCMQYAGGEAVNGRLGELIEMPFRNFSVEKPVDDDEFRFILKQYAYDKTDLNAQIEEERDGGEWIRQRISFDAAYGGERMMAYLFVPKRGRPPYQTLVFFPGSDTIYRRSSDENIRMSSIDFFLKSGRALIYPIYKGIFERGGDLPHDQPSEAVWWSEYTIMWAKDLARSIDYLETRDDIDTSKLAYFGQSWGARMGPLMLAVEDRLSLGMIYVGGLKFRRARPEADTFNFVPRVTVPFLMINGQHDFFYPAETAQRPLYEHLGTPEKDKRWVLYDGGHAVPRNKLIEETLGWLDRYFGVVE